MDIAADVMARHGYAGTRVDDICTACGFAKPTFYHYFKDKLDILESCIRSTVEETMSALDGFHDTDNSNIAARLESRLRNLTWLTVRKLPASALSFRETENLSADMKIWMRERARHFFQALEAILEEGKSRGEFSFEDKRVASHAMAGIVGFLYTWYKPAGPVEAEHLVDQITSSMMRIVLPPAG